MKTSRLTTLAPHAYTDGEVIGIEADRCLIQWDAALQQAYTSGETLEEFGAENLTQVELARATA